MNGVPPVPGELIGRAARILQAGGLVAFPTETVYGLGADADHRDAVAGIFAAKGRPSDHPLIVHVASIEAAGAWSGDIAPAANLLMRAFWPGPLTVVVARAARAHDLLTGGQDSVGLRCPAHPWARALLLALAGEKADPAAAIAAPSANRFGRISPTRAAHVREDLGEKPVGAVDCILDGGACGFGIESTIVDCTAGRVRILRPGSIDARAIAGATGLRVAAAGEDAGEDAPAPRAPGRLEKHYAPRIPLELVSGEELAPRLAALAQERIALLAPTEVRAAGVLRFACSLEDPAAYAHALYDVLRQMDASGATRILVLRPPAGPDWEAVQDRLSRAAAGSADPYAEAD